MADADPVRFREAHRVVRQAFPWVPARLEEVRHVRPGAHHDCQGRYPRVVRLVPSLPTKHPARWG
jgi:hypothetical protein